MEKGKHSLSQLTVVHPRPINSLRRPTVSYYTASHRPLGQRLTSSRLIDLLIFPQCGLVLKLRLGFDRKKKCQGNVRKRCLSSQGEAKGGESKHGLIQPIDSVTQRKLLLQRVDMGSHTPVFVSVIPCLYSSIKIASPRGRSHHLINIKQNNSTSQPAFAAIFPSNNQQTTKVRLDTDGEHEL